MDISLLNTGNMEVAAKEVSAGIILFGIFQKFERICKSKNIKLEVQIDPTAEDLIFLSDELLLKKVLIHLVDNATKFTREGKIIIGIKNRQNDLCFYVEDTGIGIAEESKKDIFKSFMQEEFGLSRSYDGSGLGLSIAKGFVELAGGDIWFDDNPEKGTTFFFTIPLIRSIKHIGKADEHPKLQTKVKILVVEDDKINLKYISILLNNELIEVLYAMDGITAVETFRSHPDIKVVLMDLIIPGQDGFKATEQIKEINAEVPVFALTALAFNEHREKAHQSGCDEFLIKPLRKIELYEKLNKYGVYLS
jgi:CheY-like chemotaxis protein